MFPTSTYIARRKALAEKIDSGLVLFLSNPYVSRNYKASVYPYRQDSTFLYYVGIAQAGLAYVLDVETGKEQLFGNELSMDDIVWTGELPTLKSRAEKVGIQTVTPYGELTALLQHAQEQGRTSISSLLTNPPLRFS